MEKTVKTTISNSVFAIIKKMLSVFLTVAIVINVVIPKSQELKENFMLAINCVAEIAQTTFYDKYAESVVNVTNGIAGNILNVLNKAGLSGEKISNEKEQAATNNEQNKKTEPINTSTESGIIIENNISSENTINILKAKTTGLAYSIDAGQLQYYNEEQTNSNSKANNIGILFFILFSILVVRIKDTIAVIYNNNGIAGINRLG